MSIVPVAFNWSGSFDGENNGSQYGYAGIQPKTAGAFYTGLQSVNNTWTGPFSLVLGDNNVVTTYTARQFMEFSVNLSKLGLDDARLFGGDDCLMPFRRVIVKTRASTSFTAELKDFVAPFDFFIAPRAELETSTPWICDTGSVSHIYVMNPIPTSVYQWSTPNGHIIGSTTGPFINVDTPGVYIVTQQLQAACSIYATDTITIGSLGSCDVLYRNLIDFSSTYADRIAHLSWKVLDNQLANYFIIERSYEGDRFEAIGRIEAIEQLDGKREYRFADNIPVTDARYVFYRVRLVQHQPAELVSRILRHHLSGKTDFVMQISPNPARDNFMLRINSETDIDTEMNLYNQQGTSVMRKTIHLTAGNNAYNFDIPHNLPGGYYLVKARTADKVQTEKILLLR
ncbi:MAG: T9SS type A sorting domain-containing protein [Chitinophagaceae bacterium]|nr:T9SS type A sorting domain-containing protein [Chitinophagaceae bacterium]